MLRRILQMVRSCIFRGYVMLQLTDVYEVQSFDRNAFGDGSVFGCDFSGTVEEVGADITRAKKGDVVAGLIWGGEFAILNAAAIVHVRVCEG